MSLVGLVQYDSSDDSEEESDNETISHTDNKTNVPNKNNADNVHEIELKPVNIVHDVHKSKLLLPDPIQPSDRLESNVVDDNDNSSNNLLLHTLPMPKSKQNSDTKIEDDEEEEEEDNDIPMPKITKFIIEKPPKKEKGPVKISIPLLSDFDDIDEVKCKKIAGPAKTCGILSLLPPPKNEITSANKLIPHVLAKTTNKNNSVMQTQIKSNSQKPCNIKNINSKIVKSSHALNSLNYDSNTDDEEEDISTVKKESTIDFFSLSKPVNLPLSEEIVAANILPLMEKKISLESEDKSIEIVENEDKASNSTLTSTVMNLPKNEILQKNKAEVGPKLPVPDQEFHIDAGGNVAFDDKAIEYLCGKRGVKRKNQIVNENDIIDINGEDIKPDEREWLVKALTEEPVRKPVSIGSGPSSQSKKKHQITYLAHQAKAMEIELQNQWAAGNMARKQTRSKYGF